MMSYYIRMLNTYYGFLELRELYSHVGMMILYAYGTIVMRIGRVENRIYYEIINQLYGV